jgi:SAM-dependent methyltransferase
LYTKKIEIPEVNAINYSVALLKRDEQERNHILRQLAFIKDKYSIKKCVLLEVGCGLGHNLELFRNDNTVFGIDGLDSAVAEARGRGLAVSRGDLESRLDIDDQSVDWILCLDVLEHLARPLNLMREMRRVLADSGRAILNVPNHFDLSGRLKLLWGHGLDVHGFFPANNDWDNPHLRFFTHRGIRQLVEISGFDVLEDRSTETVAFPKRALMERAGLGLIIKRLARGYPSLFAAGFFLIIGKKRER